MRKKLLAALLAVCMVVTLLPATVLAASFNDTDGHWAASAIERWSDAKVLNGNGDGTFNPDGTMTRAEFAQMMVNLMGYKKTSDRVFTDVSADAWYADAISKAVAAGIMNGVTNDEMDPEGIITFEQAMVIMARALGLAKTVSGDDWATETITKLTAMNIIGDSGHEKLKAVNDCQRAIVATLADELIGEYVNGETETEAKTVTGDVKGVVLAVNGATVNLDKANVAASVVAMDSTVTAKDSTVADGVKVEGSSAEVALENTKVTGDVAVVDGAVSADKASSISGNVTLAGEAPKAAVEGEIAGEVVVDPDATDPDVSVPTDTPVVVRPVDEETSEDEEELPTNKTHTHEYEAADATSADTLAATAPEPFDATRHAYTCTGAIYDMNGNVVSAETEAGQCGERKLEAHNFNIKVDDTNKAIYGEDKVGETICICGEVKPEDPTATTTTEDPTAAQLACKHVWVHDDETAAAAEAGEDEAAKEYTADCQKAGLTYQYCRICGLKQKVVTPQTDHKYDNGKITKNPTCAELGERVYTCTYANHAAATEGDDAAKKTADIESGKIMVESIPATNQHAWGPYVTTPANCTIAGSKITTCANCSATKGDVIEATGIHVWGKWEKGEGEEYVRQCTNAIGKKADGSVAKCTAVDVCNHADADAKYTSYGADGHAVTKCGKCGLDYTVDESGRPVEVAKEEHTFVEGVCSVCKATAVSAGVNCQGNHDWSDGSGVCSRCGAKHVHKYGSNDKCTVTGGTTAENCTATNDCTHDDGHNADENATCKTCGKALKDVAEKGHSYPETGLVNRCEDCGYIKSHQHTYDENGTVCTTCGAATSKHVHTYEDNNVVEGSSNGVSHKVKCDTCEDGFKTVTCTFEDQDDATEATCGVDGQKASKKCTVCNTTITGAVIPATGKHTYEETEGTLGWKETAEDSHTYIRTCKVCSQDIESTKTTTCPLISRHSTTECPLCGVTLAPNNVHNAQCTAKGCTVDACSGKCSADAPCAACADGNCGVCQSPTDPDEGDGGDDEPGTTSHTCDFSKITAVVNQDGKSCTKTCNEAGTHSVEGGKQTGSHTAGETCNVCNKKYKAADDGSGNLVEDNS